MTEDAQLWGLLAWGSPMAMSIMLGAGKATLAVVAGMSIAIPAIVGASTVTTVGLMAAVNYMSRKGPALILGPVKRT